MKRQALLLLVCTAALAQGCVLELQVLDGAEEASDTDTEDSDNAESSTSLGIDDEGPSETSTSTGVFEEGETSTSTGVFEEGESSTSTEEGTSSESTTLFEEGESSSSTEEGTSSESTTGGFFGCAAIEAEYEAAVAWTNCDVDADCKVISGHCGVGLGGCYYTVNVGVDEAHLDDLAEAYVIQACTEGICDCPQSPDFAICDAGTCVGG